MKLSKRGLKAAGIFFAILMGCTAIALFLSIGVTWMMDHWSWPATMAGTLLPIFITASVFIYFATADD